MLQTAAKINSSQSSLEHEVEEFGAFSVFCCSHSKQHCLWLLSLSQLSLTILCLVYTQQSLTTLLYGYVFFLCCSCLMSTMFLLTLKQLKFDLWFVLFSKGRRCWRHFLFSTVTHSVHRCIKLGRDGEISPVESTDASWGGG